MAAAAIGRRILELRRERGLSQRDLQAPGVSYAFISRIENGQRHPSEKALRKLAAKLSTTPLYLETGDPYGVCPHCRREVSMESEYRITAFGVVIEDVRLDSLIANFPADNVRAAYGTLDTLMAADESPETTWKFERHVDGTYIELPLKPSESPTEAQAEASA